MAGRRRWLPPAAWWNLPLPALASSAAWITQIYFSEDLSALTQASLVAIGVLASALTVLLPALEIRRERGRIVAAEQMAADRLAEYKVTTNDMLIPLSLAVTDVLTTSSGAARREARQSLRQMTVDFAAETSARNAAGPASTAWRTPRRPGPGRCACVPGTAATSRPGPASTRPTRWTRRCSRWSTAWTR